MSVASDLISHQGSARVHTFETSPELQRKEQEHWMTAAERLFRETHGAAGINGQTLRVSQRPLKCISRYRLPLLIPGLLRQAARASACAHSDAAAANTDHSKLLVNDNVTKAACPCGSKRHQSGLLLFCYWAMVTIVSWIYQSRGLIVPQRSVRKTFVTVGSCVRDPSGDRPARFV